MGRHPSPNAKRVTLKFRISVSDANDIFHAATQEGKTYSQFIRDVLWDYIEARYGDYYDVPEEQMVLPGIEMQYGNVVVFGNPDAPKSKTKG